MGLYQAFQGFQPNVNRPKSSVFNPISNKLVTKEHNERRVKIRFKNICNIDIFIKQMSGGQKKMKHNLSVIEIIMIVVTVLCLGFVVGLSIQNAAVVSLTESQAVIDSRLKTLESKVEGNLDLMMAIEGDIWGEMNKMKEEIEP
jgi:hypothetical protein